MNAPHRTGRFLGGELGHIAAVGAGALVFGVLLILVRLRWLPLESVDHGLAGQLNGTVAGNATAVKAMDFASRLGSHGFLGWLLAITVVVLALRRRWRLVVYLLAAGAGAIILDPTLKVAVGRLRPVVDHPVAVGGGNSFPSGHALGSIIVYGALLLVFAPALSTRARRWVTAGLAVVVVLIGLSRIGLGVHFLSDVLGAWCLGVAWLGVTAYAFELWRREHGRRVTEPLAEGLEPEAAADLRPAEPAIADAGLRNRVAIAGGVVGWVLIFGVLLAIGIPLARYHKGNGNILGDTTIPHWLAAHRTGWLNTFSYLGSEAGNTHAIMAVGLIVGAAALALIRQWRPVVFLVVTMFAELTLFLGTAALTDRPRPDVPHLDGPLPTSSYPSGHVAATICLYVAIALVVWPRTRSWWRWIPVAAAVLMPLWVGLSRMYRGMHHPTDLIGSLVLAGALLALTVYVVRPNCDVAEKGYKFGYGGSPRRVPAEARSRAHAGTGSGRAPAPR
jgi:undecaprenyl-diphosphatase